VSDICSPVGTPVYWSLRRRLMAVLFILVGIAVLSWSVAKVEAKLQTQKCSSVLWRLGVYNIESDTYAKKCGCPNSLDYRFSCNSQYLPLL
jgi:hypothetical protein